MSLLFNKEKTIFAFFGIPFGKSFLRLEYKAIISAIETQTTIDRLYDHIASTYKSTSADEVEAYKRGNPDYLNNAIRQDPLIFKLWQVLSKYHEVERSVAEVIFSSKKKNSKREESFLEDDENFSILMYMMDRYRLISDESGDVRPFAPGSIENARKHLDDMPSSPSSDADFIKIISSAGGTGN